MKKVLATFGFLLLFITSSVYSQTVSLGTSTTVTNPQRSGESSTGIFSPSSGNIGFSALGTQTMSISTTGVGIGTAAPVRALNLVTNVTGSGVQIPQFEFDNAGAVRSTLYNNGIQYWYLSNTTSEAGQILYSLPSGNPGIIFLNAGGTGRSQISLGTSTGGLGFAAETGSGALSSQMFLSTQGYLGLNTLTPTVSLDASHQTDAISLPAGTTGQRPATLRAGEIRYNSDTPAVEAYVGSTWVNLGAGGSSGGIAGIQTFASAGTSTWTKPSGISANSVSHIECWGAGGGGASSTQGGGGGGGYRDRWVASLVLSSTVSVTIGTGGPGSTTGCGPGTDGGDTTFGSYLTAYGGGGGQCTDGGRGGGITHASGQSTNYYDGGNGAGTGQNGGAAVYGGGGGGANAGSTGGTSAFGGTGGAGGSGGSSGIAPGGGGGSSGGNGAAGQCIVTTWN